MTSFAKLCLVALLLIPLLQAGTAARSTTQSLVPANLFSDSMVLQRDTAVPVWGTAKAGETVTVSFRGQTKKAKADPNGKWLVSLRAMPAAKIPQEMKIKSSQETRLIKDVVVGDVWLCSGQSNMHFRMKSVENSQTEIAAANNPSVRFFSVGERFSQQPAEDLKGEWSRLSPETAAECSAVAYYFAQAVQAKRDVPIGLIVSSVGGTRIETWMSPETLTELGLSAGLLAKWQDIPAVEFEHILEEYRAYQHYVDWEHPEEIRAAKAKGEPVPPLRARPAMRGHDCPGALHHGMIFPLQPYSLRGVLWYQGEANVGAPGAYSKLQSALIADWRKIWGAELPFLFVQLPPHKTVAPAFREAQFQVWQSTPHTAMVVTTDVGDAENIHPVRKRPVGERLAAAALALAYGQAVEYSGPILSNLTIDENRAVLSFAHVGGGLIAKDGKLRGFMIAGADGKFVAAHAEIQGETVVVTADGIAQPVFVRYGWANVPDVNLFNREGFPAVPFHPDSPPTDPLPAATGH